MVGSNYFFIFKFKNTRYSAKYKIILYFSISIYILANYWWQYNARKLVYNFSQFRCLLIVGSGILISHIKVLTACNNISGSVYCFWKLYFSEECISWIKMGTQYINRDMGILLNHGGYKIGMKTIWTDLVCCNLGKKSYISQFEHLVFWVELSSAF
jgi:hypothetical protein